MDVITCAAARPEGKSLQAVPEEAGFKTESIETSAHGDDPDSDPSLKTSNSYMSQRLESGLELETSLVLLENRLLKIEEKRSSVEALLDPKSSAQNKQKGLNILRATIISLERLIQRVRTAKFIEQYTNSQPNFGGEGTLIFACQVLKPLLLMTDQTMMQSEKVERWIGDAAALYARAIGLLDCLNANYHNNNSEGFYQEVVQHLSNDLQSHPERLECPLNHAVAECPATFHPTEIRLLIIVAFHSSLWSHARGIAEIWAHDAVWPVEKGLKGCQAKVQTNSRKLFTQMIRAHRSGLSKAGKSIAELALQAYNEALLQLSVTNPISLRTAHSWLEITLSLWRDSPFSLRHELQGIGQPRYFALTHVWQHLQVFLSRHASLDREITLSLLELMPLLGASQPAEYRLHCLEPMMKVFLDLSQPTIADVQIRQIGQLVKAVRTEIGDYRKEVFQFLLVHLEKDQHREAVYRSSMDILEGLGPTATSEFEQLMEMMTNLPTSVSKITLLRRIPRLIPNLGACVYGHLLQQLVRLREHAPNDESAPEWLAFLQMLPEIALIRVDLEIKDSVQQFLLAAIAPTSPITVLKEALSKARHPTLCDAVTSRPIVDKIIGCMDVRQDHEALKLFVQTLSHSQVGFEAKTVTQPLLYLLNSSHVHVQMAVLRLLNLQVIRYPALLIPVIRNYVRRTLLRIDGLLDIAEAPGAPTKVDEPLVHALFMNVCLAIPALPMSLASQYSRPVLTILLNTLERPEQATPVTNRIMEAILHLAKHAPHIWCEDNLLAVVKHCSRISDGTPPADRKQILRCLAGLMAHPHALSIQPVIVSRLFADYVFTDVELTNEVKVEAMSVIGQMGTTDRNPRERRDHAAAIKRENSLYDSLTKRKVATAVMRDKMGVLSLQYQLSIISASLKITLEGANISEKVAIWTGMMKLCLLAPDESYVEQFPSIISEINKELKISFDKEASRPYRPKLLLLLSQAMLLKPCSNADLELRCTCRLILQFLHEPRMTDAVVSSALSVTLSIVSKSNASLLASPHMVIPIVVAALESGSVIEFQTIEFGLKLLAVFLSGLEPYLSKVLDAVIKLSAGKYSNDYRLHEVRLKFLAHLAGHVALFDHMVQIRKLMTEITAGEIAEYRWEQMIEASLSYIPSFEGLEEGDLEYPDLREYQTIQFANLTLTPADRADMPFSEKPWDFANAHTKYEWQVWSDQLMRAIVDSSHSEALKIAAEVSAFGFPQAIDRKLITRCLQLQRSIPKSIFCSALASYWDKLKPGDRNWVGEKLDLLLTQENTPENIVHYWLGLVEYMNRAQFKLSHDLLRSPRCVVFSGDANLHERCDPLWLWYSEIDIDNNGGFKELDQRKLENLIESNIRVGIGSNVKQDDAAWSAIQLAQDSIGLQPKSMWLNALGLWDDAIVAARKEDQSDFRSLATRIECNHNLTNFEENYHMAQTYWQSFTHIQKLWVGNWVAIASFSVGDFESMSHYIMSLKKGSQKSLYKAILDIKDGKLEDAHVNIEKAHSWVHAEIRARTGYIDFGSRNYASAVRILGRSQLLEELKEVMQHQRLTHRPDLQHHMRTIWQQRLQTSHQDIDSFYLRLLVWSLAAKPSELQDGWVHLAKMCHKKGLSSARLILNSIGSDNQPGNLVSYTRILFDWANADGNISARNDIYNDMMAHTIKLSGACGFPEGVLCHFPRPTFPSTGINISNRGSQKTRLARCLSRLSQWKKTLQKDGWVQDLSDEAYILMQTSVMIDDSWHGSLDGLARMALDLLEERHCVSDAGLSTETIEHLVLPASFALFRIVQLQSNAEQSLKAALLTITLWFRHGMHPKVLMAIRRHLARTELRPWLAVIPQLIARMGAKDLALRDSLLEFLIDISHVFPDAICWPLLTASQTPRSVHQDAARSIMRKMELTPTSGEMMKEARLVCKELMRTALTWAERWKTNIEKLLYIEGVDAVSWYDFEEEYSTLKAPQTEDEILFVQRFAEGLWLAKKEMDVHLRSGRRQSYHNACKEFQQVYRQLTVYLDDWRKPGFQINLYMVAPKLVAVRDSRLIVPGQYDPSLPSASQQYIKSFDTKVDVLTSLQLPRRLTLQGSSEEFQFLLKGNEDLRQDERIMQLVMLTNTLLNHNIDAFYRQLFVQPYSVIPLSPDAGLLTWVPNTETYMQMIVSSRAKIQGNRTSDQELAALLGMTVEALRGSWTDFDKIMRGYDALPILKKVEQYTNAVKVSKNDDLRQTLWRRSPNSSTWITRRTCFARSIATTSMIGSVIGLGDRHPANTLVEQTKFNAISIDFGLVFDAAKERALYAEKIPFRLTPQIWNAFEFAARAQSPVPASRGHFKASSVITMKVLREAKETLLAMLEAFAYDPLLTWQGTDHQEAVEEKAPRDTAPAPHHPEDMVGKPKHVTLSLKPSIHKDIRNLVEPQRDITINLGGSFIAPGSVRHTQRSVLLSVAEEGSVLSAPEDSLQDSLDRQLKTAKTNAAHLGKGIVQEDSCDVAPSEVCPADGKTGAVIGSTTTNNSASAGTDPYVLRMANIMTNERALKVLNAIERRLSGYEFNAEIAQDAESHVQTLIEEATDPANLAQGYVIGWQPAW